MRHGLRTMRMHGAQKVLEGVTTIAEVLRQTEEEAVISPEPEPEPSLPDAVAVAGR
jgi:hypothetical protein